MSGQMSGQVPNQAGSRGGLSQQNGNSNLFGQVQNQGDHQTNGNPNLFGLVQNQGDHLRHWGRNWETGKVRGFLQSKIYERLMMWRQPQSSELKRIVELVGILEKHIFNAASTIEEYTNLETLENRVFLALKHIWTQHQQKKQLQQVNSSSGNQFMRHVDSSSPINLMTLTPGGFVPGGYIFSTSPGSNGMVSSGGGGGRVLSQMLPTPENNGMVSSGVVVRGSSSQMVPAPGNVYASINSPIPVTSNQTNQSI